MTSIRGGTHLRAGLGDFGRAGGGQVQPSPVEEPGADSQNPWHCAGRRAPTDPRLDPQPADTQARCHIEDPTGVFMA